MREGGGGGWYCTIFKIVSWPIGKSFEWGLSDMWVIIPCNYFGEKMVCLVTRLRQNTASESAVLDPPPPPNPHETMH